MVDKCTWKIIAEDDDIKRESREGYVTLNKDKRCYSCDGFDETCGAYHVNSRNERSLGNFIE